MKSQIAYKKERWGILAKIIGKAYFIVNARAGQFDDFCWCESYAKPDFISVRTRLPLYKGDVGVHYLKVLVKILKEDEFVATFGLQGEEDGKMLVIRML